MSPLNPKRGCDRFLPRKWPCPACGKSSTMPVDIPRICRDCQMDADQFSLGVDTLHNMPTRDDNAWVWLRGVLAARRIRSVANGNGPCSPSETSHDSEDQRA